MLKSKNAMEKKLKQITVVNHLTAGKGMQEGGKEQLEFCTDTKARQRQVKYNQR